MKQTKKKSSNLISLCTGFQSSHGNLGFTILNDDVIQLIIHYFINFIDDSTRKAQVDIMASKDYAFSCFQKFLTLVKTQPRKKLKCLHTINGREYVSNEFKNFCESKGIRCELIAPYTLAQNGVAKRMNWTIQE